MAEKHPCKSEQPDIRCADRNHKNPSLSHILIIRGKNKPVVQKYPCWVLLEICNSTFIRIGDFVFIVAKLFQELILSAFRYSTFTAAVTITLVKINVKKSNHGP